MIIGHIFDQCLIFAIEIRDVKEFAAVVLHLLAELISLLLLLLRLERLRLKYGFRENLRGGIPLLHRWLLLVNLRQLRLVFRDLKGFVLLAVEIQQADLFVDKLIVMPQDRLIDIVGVYIHFVRLVIVCDHIFEVLLSHFGQLQVLGDLGKLLALVEKKIVAVAAILELLALVAPWVCQLHVFHVQHEHVVE